MAEATCAVSNNPHRLSLKHIYIQGGIRVFYNIDGSHKIPNLSDKNRNNVPDLVEDVALHTALSRGIFNASGFRDPLLSPRYLASDYIDVELVDFSLYRSTVSNNRGFAFSGQYKSTSSIFRGEKCSLMIVLNTVAPNFEALTKDFLIPHEVFHLYQYSYTEFKQPWLHEGLAKWAERATQNRSSFDSESRRTPLPDSKDSFSQAVLQHPNPYATQRFWASLLSAANFPDDECRIPPEWRKLTFTDGSPIIRNTNWHGCTAVQKFYSTLQQRTMHISAANGRIPFEWSESQRRTPACNFEIIGALRQTIEQELPSVGTAPLISVLKHFDSGQHKRDDTVPSGC